MFERSFLYNCLCDVIFTKEYTVFGILALLNGCTLWHEVSFIVEINKFVCLQLYEVKSIVMYVMKKKSNSL